MRRPAVEAICVAGLILAFQCQARAQDFPEGWVVYPSPSADDFSCAAHSKRSWEVSREGKTIEVRLRQWRRDNPLPFAIASEEGISGINGARHIEKVTDGWLVGFDAGEFGGSLWWFSSEGESREQLWDDNVVGFTRDASGILALTGLSHLGSDYGKVLGVEKAQEGDWKAEALADLGAAPRTFTSESPESLLVVTTDGLVRVERTGVTELLFPMDRFLYPNSMTLALDGVIHVGMRHFIMRLTPIDSGYQQEWFVPLD